MRILVGGDYCPWERVSQSFENNDFSAIEAIRPYVEQADYSIVNLECPIAKVGAKPIVKSGPNLCSSIKSVVALQKLGVRCVTLANNHFFDYGQSGVESTLSALGQYGMDYVGGGATVEESATILFKEIGNECLAIINCCEHESSIANENHGGSNPLNPLKQYYAIQEARNIADYVLVIVHGGPEHYQLPSPRMQDTYRFFIDTGADVVINHHQHCYSGYELYNGKPIFYGLGNLCFDRSKRNSPWNNGYILNIILTKNAIDFQLIPYNQCDVEPKILLLNKEKESAFNARIAELNAVIANSHKLTTSYHEFLKKTRRHYRFYVEPYKSRIAKYLYKLGLLPSMMKRKYVVLSNVISCESHVERLIDALKQDK